MRQRPSREVMPGGCLPGGVCLGVSAQGGVCQGVSAWEVSARGCLPRGVRPERGCLPKGGLLGMSAPMYAGIHTPCLPGKGVSAPVHSVDRMTDACENITLPQHN